MNHLCQFALKLVYLLRKHHVLKFGNGRCERMYVWKEGRTNEHGEVTVFSTVPVY